MSDEFEHRFIPGALASAPTILALRTAGPDQTDLVPLARMIDGDAAIFCLRARLKEKRLLRLFRRGRHAFDPRSLRAQTRALAGFLQTAAPRHHFARNRIVGFGYAGGATLAGGLLFAEPEALAGAILLRPAVPFEPEPQPALAGRPVLISGGRKAGGGRKEIERLAGLLEGCGAQVTVLWHDAGDAPLPGELEAIGRWWSSTFTDQGSGARP